MKKLTTLFALSLPLFVACSKGDGVTQSSDSSVGGSTSDEDNETATGDTESTMSVESECEPDDVKDSSDTCGLNGGGVFESVCEEGLWVTGTDCLDPDACTNDETRSGTTACGLNDAGVLEHLCAAGAWENTTNCVDADDCTNDETRTGVTACGNNNSGLTQEWCDDGQWQEDIETCLGADTCQNNAIQTGTTSCGFNDTGLAQQTCTEGDWLDDGTCIGATGECTNNDTQVGTTLCGFNDTGLEQQTCVTGGWLDDGTCLGATGVCTDQDTQLGTTPCGLNDTGVMWQTCDDLGVWGDDGPFDCFGETGECTNNDTQSGTTPCGNTPFGTLEQLCLNGSWGESATCEIDGDPFNCAGEFSTVARVVLSDGQSTPYSTVESAVLAAVSGSTVQVCPGIFAVQEMDVYTGITVMGSGQDITILNGKNNNRIMFSHGTTTVSDLTIWRGLGTAGGGMRVSASIPDITTLSRITFEDNEGMYGGALNVGGWSDFVGTDLIFRNNYASRGLGGALYLAANFEFTNVVFDENNAATEGGAVYIAGGICALPEDCTMTNVTFFRNSAEVRGGAISFDEFQALTCTNCNFGEGDEDNTPNDIYSRRGSHSDYGDGISFVCTAADGCPDL